MQKHLFTGLAVALAALTLSTPASAEFREYKDYTYSESVVELTTVRVDPGQFETYLEGLKGTWVMANEVAKKLGHITDYGIYVNEAPASGSFHIMLVIEFPGENTQPSRKRYDDFMAAWGQANIDKSNETVVKLYNEIREIQGVYRVREVNITQ